VWKNISGARVAQITGRVYFATLDGLLSAIRFAHRKSMEVTTTRELVIRYNVESHVSFAEDENGVVYPNAGYPGAKWAFDAGRYGDHHSGMPSTGGYSLTIGARAVAKITHRHGDCVKVSYEPYYGKGTHLVHCCPASVLNSWCSFILPEQCAEMPYSDEAATFFHEMMLGMAGISKRLQSIVGDQDKLLEVIASGQRILPAPVRRVDGD
jgi:hypothetical protein